MGSQPSPSSLGSGKAGPKTPPSGITWVRTMWCGDWVACSPLLAIACPFSTMPHWSEGEVSAQVVKPGPAPHCLMTQETRPFQKLSISGTGTASGPAAVTEDYANKESSVCIISQPLTSPHFTDALSYGSVPVTMWEGRNPQKTSRVRAGFECLQKILCPIHCDRADLYP